MDQSDSEQAKRAFKIAFMLIADMLEHPITESRAEEYADKAVTRIEDELGE